MFHSLALHLPSFSFFLLFGCFTHSRLYLPSSFSFSFFVGLAPPTDLTQVIGAPLPSSSHSQREEDDDEDQTTTAAAAAASNSSSSSVKRKEKRALLPYKMIRTDATMGNLRSFLYTPEQQQQQQQQLQESQDSTLPPSLTPSQLDNSDTGTAADVRDRGAVPLMTASSSSLPSSSSSSSALTWGGGGGGWEGGREGGKDRHYRRRLPSFVETKCQYLSVRALVADVHDRVHQ